MKCLGSRDGFVMRALASHQGVPGLTPKLHAISVTHNELQFHLDMENQPPPRGLLGIQHGGLEKTMANRRSHALKILEIFIVSKWQRVCDWLITCSAVCRVFSKLPYLGLDNFCS